MAKQIKISFNSNSAYGMMANLWDICFEIFKKPWKYNFYKCWAVLWLSFFKGAPVLKQLLCSLVCLVHLKWNPLRMTRHFCSDDRWSRIRRQCHQAGRDQQAGKDVMSDRWCFPFLEQPPVLGAGQNPLTPSQDTGRSSALPEACEQVTLSPWLCCSSAKEGQWLPPL